MRCKNISDTFKVARVLCRHYDIIYLSAFFYIFINTWKIVFPNQKKKKDEKNKKTFHLSFNKYQSNCCTIKFYQSKRKKIVWSIDYGNYWNGLKLKSRDTLILLRAKVSHTQRISLMTTALSRFRKRWQANQMHGILTEATKKDRDKRNETITKRMCIKFTHICIYTQHKSNACEFVWVLVYYSEF